jgi:hypothetical protein
MGKVKQMLQESEEMNGPLEEPTDAELQEIENTLDTIAWEDTEWLDPDVEIPVK